MDQKKTQKLWKHHFNEETDAAFLYRELSKRTKDEDKKSIYERLAFIEGKHLDIWKKLLEENHIKLGNTEPSLKAKMMVFLADHFSIKILSAALMLEEATEVKDYMHLYKFTSDSNTKDIAFQLAKDSAGHADKLMGIKGTDSEPWHKSESGGLIRSIVYGFNDGLTANFGLIAGMIGAAQSSQSIQSHIILVTGMAGMIADSLSMGSSGYLASISEKEVYENERLMEQEEIKIMPDVEAEELALIYESKGMTRDESRKLAFEIIKNPDLALQEKMREELGIIENESSPVKEGTITGIATAIGALIPVVPFLFFHGWLAIWLSFTISMLAHFGVGAARSFFTGRGIFKSGFDMFVVGFGVAAVGFLVGDWIIKLFQ